MHTACSVGRQAGGDGGIYEREAITTRRETRERCENNEKRSITTCNNRWPAAGRVLGGRAMTKLVTAVRNDVKSSFRVRDCALYASVTHVTSSRGRMVT